MLIPGHLLFGRKINLENISKSISFNNEDLNKLSQHFHNLLEHFRNRWRTEYLTALRENQNCKVKDHGCKIKKGDVVIIIHTARSHVHYGRLQRSKNYCYQKKVRGATIKYLTNGKAVVINRPINKPYLIEPVKQTGADIQPKFVDDKKICQIETT